MPKETFKKLVKELGNHVGIENLTPDKDNYCCIGFDDKIAIHIQFNKDNKVLMLFAQLGTIEKDKQALLYPRLLEANLFWQGTGGATLGVDSKTNEALLSYQIPISLLDFEKFRELVEGFVNTAELWINSLTVIQKGLNTPQAASTKK